MRGPLLDLMENSTAASTCATLAQPPLGLHPYDISCYPPEVTMALFLQTDRPLRTYGYDGEDFWDNQTTVTTLGYYAYCESEGYEHLVTGFDGPGVAIGARVIPPEVWEMVKDQRWVSHNAPYDITRHARMIALGIIPNVWPKEWVCTANMTCFCQQGPRSLADSVRAVFGVEVSKDTRQEVKGFRWKHIQRSRGIWAKVKPGKTKKAQREWAAMTTQDTMDFALEDQPGETNLEERFCTYVHSDAKWSRELFEAQAPLMPPKERLLSAMTMWQGMQGFAFDGEEVDRQIRALGKALRVTEEQLPWVELWDKKPMSTQGVKRYCEQRGIRPPRSMSKDSEEFADWLEEYAERAPWIAALKQWRELNDAHVMLSRIRTKVMPNGRSQFTLKYAGAGATARWSGDGGLNLQALRKSVFGISEKTGEMHQPFPREKLPAFRDRCAQEGWVCVDLRGTIRARSGYRIGAADLAQIEPRCQAWYASDTLVLEKLSQGISVYVAHAQGTMGAAADFTKEKNPTLYDLAKKRVLSLGYGAGWIKFYEILRKDGQLSLLDEPVTEEEVEAWAAYAQAVHPTAYAQAIQDSERMRRSVKAWLIVEDFRHAAPQSDRYDKRAGKFYSRQVDMQKTLEEQMHTCLGGDFTITLASGRKLVYKDITCTASGVERGIWEGTVGGKRKKLYGGLLYENLIQATARDVFCDGLIRLIGMGVHILFSVHDEVVVEIPEWLSVQVICDALEVPPSWMPGMTVGSEGYVSDRYKK